MSDARQGKGSWGEFLGFVKSLGFYPSTTVDVGVAEGTDKLYTMFPRSKVILVEPVEEFRPALEEIAKKYNGKYIIAAAGPEEGSIPIRVYEKKSGSSIMPATGNPESQDKRDRIVPMIRLDSLLPDVETPVLLKLDIQGAELLALDGAPKLLAVTDLVILETSMFSFHTGMPQFHDVVHYMKERGFSVYDIIGGSYRPYDRALGQVDLVFAKDEGIFRNSNAWA